MSEIMINKNNFQKEVMESDKPVLIDFFATWCGPCKMISPIISQIADENADKIKVGKVDVDKEGELASAFRVVSIPILAVVKDGKITATAVGFRSKSEILDLLK